MKEAREESTKERMLLLLELSKEMGKNNVKKVNKYNVTTTRRLYKSFENIYLWMPYNKKWKLGHFYKMNV